MNIGKPIPKKNFFNINAEIAVILVEIKVRLISYKYNTKKCGLKPITGKSNRI